MTSFNKAIIASALFAACCSVAPAQAQLLGGSGSGLLGTVTDTVGSVVSVESGPSSSDSLVNVGIGNGGGDSGNILGVETGRGLSGVADIQIGNRNGGIQAGVDVVGLDIDVDLFGRSPGTPGVPGRNTTVVLGGGGGSGGAGVGVRLAGTCSVEQGRQLLQMAAKAKVAPQTWRRAANVQIVPVKLCDATRREVAKVLGASGKVNQLQGAVSYDPLISASLERTRYRSDDVFAVASANGNLTVYVY